MLLLCCLVAEILRSAFGYSVDVVYESVGGETFEMCVNNLSRFGRLIIVGMISQYQNQSAFQQGAGASRFIADAY
jgi:NADPH-dependent curcumin reductase CurA